MRATASKYNKSFVWSGRELSLTSPCYYTELASGLGELTYDYDSVRDPGRLHFSRISDRTKQVDFLIDKGVKHLCSDDHQIKKLDFKTVYGDPDVLIHYDIISKDAFNHTPVFPLEAVTNL